MTFTNSQTGGGGSGLLYRNPLVRVRFDEKLTIDLPLERRQFQVSDPQILSALSLLPEAGTREEICSLLLDAGVADRADAAECIVEELLEADFLHRDIDESGGWAAAQHWIDRGWLEALLFHTACETDGYIDDGVPDAVQLHDNMLQGEVAAGLPPLWTRYEGRPIVILPPGRAADELPGLPQTLLQRRSNQPWRVPQGPALEDLATVMRLASEETVSVRRRAEREVERHPSALLHSAFTALELYVVVHRVTGLEAGLYHYEPDAHQLRLLRAGDLRQEMQRFCVGQQRAASASAVFIATAVWERYMIRYPQPAAYRTLLMNVGELAQKLVVLSTAVGLSTFITPAFDDAYADEVLAMDPTVESPMEVVSVG